MPLVAKRKLTESWIKQQTAYGLMRQNMARDVVTLSGTTGLQEMVAHAKKTTVRNTNRHSLLHAGSEQLGAG